VSDTLQQWFVREIISHEIALTHFLLRLWRDREEVADLRQEIYARVYEAAARQRPASPRSFLFATARHLIADRIRRGKIVSIELRGNLDSLNVFIDEISPEHSIAVRQELRQLTQAFELLPTQCREIMWMRKVEGLAQKEVAMRLGLNEKAVEKRLARGLRLLAEAFCEEPKATKRRGRFSLFKRESDHG
jgi:RNA polymerase sigma factor (sigma-70 family)